MKVNSAIATTSSRLDREAELPTEVEAQKQTITARTITYCHNSLERSHFFCLLKDRKVDPPLISKGLIPRRSAA